MYPVVIDCLTLTEISFGANVRMYPSRHDVTFLLQQLVNSFKDLINCVWKARSSSAATSTKITAEIKSAVSCRLLGGINFVIWWSRPWPIPWSVVGTRKNGILFGFPFLH